MPRKRIKRTRALIMIFLFCLLYQPRLGWIKIKNQQEAMNIWYATVLVQENTTLETQFTFLFFVCGWKKDILLKWLSNACMIGCTNKIWKRVKTHKD